MPIGGAILGGIAGGKEDVVTQNQDYTVNAGPLSELGQQGSDAASSALKRLLALLQGQDSVNANAPAQYAKMLQQMIESGGLPNQQQIGAANQYASDIFSPQQAALNSVFQRAGVDTARNAAQLGRSTDDPILAAKLAQYKGQQQGVLSGQQTALGSQLALQLPQQQLGYAQALSAQALQNQSTLLGLGQGVLSQAQNYALATARRTGTSTQTSGGGFKGAVSGAFKGFGAGFQAFNALGSGGFQGFDKSSGSGYASGDVAAYGAGGEAGGMYGAGDFGATTVGGSGIEAAALA